MSKRIYEENRGGQIYIHEIESYWCKIKKAPRQKRTYLGKKDLTTGMLITKKNKGTAHIPSGSKIFGSIYFLENISVAVGLKDILKKIFPKQFEQILHLSYFKILRKEAYYLYPYWHNEAYVSNKTQQSSQELSDFLLNLGVDEKSVEFFFKHWIEKNQSSGAVMFDITSLSSYGVENEFLEKGYNRDGDVLKQINLGVISKNFKDKSGHLPLAYRIYPGSITDVTTLKNISNFIESYDLKTETFIMDKGFYSQQNIKEMSMNKLNFLVPMSFATKQSKEILSKIKKRIFPPVFG